MNPVEIYVECEVLPVRLQLAPASAASDLETLVLQAIDPGDDDIGSAVGGQSARRVDTNWELAMLFGLTPRMMIDLLGDLWRAQRVTIDFGAKPERIRLTDRARSELKTLESDGRLESSLRATDTQDVLLEMLTGTVRPIGAPARWRARHGGLKVPRMSDDKRPADIERHELTVAVKKNLERDDNRPPFRVLDAHLLPNPHQTGNRVQYFPITVNVGIDQLSRLLVHVDDRNLTREAQRKATERLQKLIEDDPTNNFVRALRGQATPVLEQAERVDRQLAALQRSIHALASTAQPNRQSDHDRVASSAALIGAQIRDMASRQMRIRTLRTAEEHKAEIIEMIDSAENQVVIAVPWIRYGGLFPYVAALEAAVQKGVQITILWGIDRSRESLDNAVLNAFDRIERTARANANGGAVYFDRSLPSHVHAKLVLVDDRRILVTSKNFFTDSDYAEFGISATARGNLLCPVAEDVLRWARDTTPSDRVAERLITERATFGNRSTPALALPDPPTTTAAVFSGSPESAPVKIWATAWQAVGDTLTHSVQQLLPVVYLVTDGLHRALMWESLRTASSRVVICSDQLSPDVVTDGFIEEVDRCLTRGTDVALVYRRFPHNDEPRSERQVEALTALATGRDPGHGHLVVRRNEATHAKVLVADDSVVIGSYNYLSFEATYRSGRRRQRSEVSLQLQSASVADSVTHMVVGHATRDTHLTAGIDNRAANAANDLIANNLVARLVEGPATPATAHAIASQCRSGTTEFAVADALVGAGLELDVLERLYAAVLSQLTDSEPGFAAWAGRLLDVLWRRGNWTAAHLIRQAINVDTVQPRLGLTAAAAAYGSKHAADMLEEAVLADSISIDEAVAVAVYGTELYLQTGVLALRDPVYMRIESLPGEVQDFVNAAFNQVQDFGLLPRDALVAAASIEDQRGDSDHAWAALADALASFRRANLSSMQEQLTRNHLLATDGPLQTLQVIADSRDFESVRRWLSDNDDTRGQWLDKATRESGSHHLIHGRSRRVMLTKTGDIFRLATTVVESQSTAESRPYATVSPEWMADLRRLVDLADHVRAKLARNAEGTFTARILDILTTTLAAGAVDGDSRVETTTTLGTWRYPGLCVADLNGNPTPRDRARTAAMDLYRALDSEQAVGWLVETGEFLAADELIDQLANASAIALSSTVALRDRVETAHAQALESALVRRGELIARYDRAEIVSPKFPDLDKSLELRSAPTTDELTRIEAQLAAAEAHAASNLRNALAAQRDSIPAQWAKHIDELVDIGELRLARNALDKKTDTRLLVPLHVAERPWRWPYFTLEQIVRRLSSSLHRTPGMESFVPDDTDPAGQRLLSALGKLAATEPGAIADYVTAIQGLIAQVDVDPIVDEVDDTFSSILTFPDATRLPRLAFVGREGTRITIGEQTGDTKIRLSLAVTERSTHGKQVVIDISSVLSLLAKDYNGRTRDRSDRAIALLRLICTQLEFADVIAADALEYRTFEELRPRLWWLLYLLSVAQGPGLVDGLLELSGGHNRPLWEILRQELGRSRKDRRLFSLDNIRHDLDVIAVESVIHDINDDAATAVLFVMIGYHVRDEQGIRDGVVDILLTLQSQVSVDGIIDIDRVLQTLRSKKYLVDTTSENCDLTLCGCGVVRAVARADTLHTAKSLIKQLVAAHEQDRRRSSRDALHRRAAIGYLHQLGRPASGVGDDPRADVEANRRATELEDEWLPSMVVDIYDECAKVWQRCRSFDTTVDVLFGPSENPGATCFLPPLAVVLLVENLVRNAIEAAVSTAGPNPAESGTVSINIGVDGGFAVIDVSDSGPGVPDSVRTSLDHNQIPMSSKHPGRGVGLKEALNTVADHGGSLNIVSDDNRWGGAHFRATLPLHPSQLDARPSG